MADALATPDMLKDAAAAVLYINSMEETHGFFVLTPSEQILLTRCERAMRAGKLGEAEFYKLEGIRMALRTLWDGPQAALSVEHGPDYPAPGYELTGAKRLGYVVQKRKS